MYFFPHALFFFLPLCLCFVLFLLFPFTSVRRTLVHGFYSYSEWNLFSSLVENDDKICKWGAVKLHFELCISCIPVLLLCSGRLPGSIWQSSADMSDCPEVVQLPSLPVNPHRQPPITDDYPHTIQTNFTSMFSASENTDMSAFARQSSQLAYDDWNFTSHHHSPLPSSSHISHQLAPLLDNNAAPLSSSRIRRNFSTESLIPKIGSLELNYRAENLGSNFMYISQSNYQQEELQAKYKEINRKIVQLKHQRHSLQQEHGPASCVLQTSSNSCKTHRRNLSAGNPPLYVGGATTGFVCGALGSNWNSCQSASAPARGTGLVAADNATASSVWSLQCLDGLVIVGCADGNLEVWDAYNGDLKVSVMLVYRFLYKWTVNGKSPFITMDRNSVQN